MRINFFTIGVYGSSEDLFFSKLINNNIDTFLDIRRRRGVRGAKYSFVNSKRLQNRLQLLGIRYKYIIDLSPTNQIRELQKKDDSIKGILKKERHFLSKIFIDEYTDKILKQFNLQELVLELESQDSKNVVFFCVEKEYLACHRSIITDHLKNEFDCTIIHL